MKKVLNQVCSVKISLLRRMSDFFFFIFLWVTQHWSKDRIVFVQFINVFWQFKMLNTNLQKCYKFTLYYLLVFYLSMNSTRKLPFWCSKKRKRPCCFFISLSSIGIIDIYIIIIFPACHWLMVPPTRQRKQSKNNLLQSPSAPPGKRCSEAGAVLNKGWWEQLQRRVYVYSIIDAAQQSFVTCPTNETHV